MTESWELVRLGVRVGTASWTDPTLVERSDFYPHREMSAAERLRFYAGRFPLVEVDSTYYSPPSRRVAGLWVERTPAEFQFDVKAFRLLTRHPTPPSSLWKDLRNQLPAELTAKRNVYARDLPRELLAEAFARFASALMPLHSAGKLGCVLFQLPHYVYPTPASFRYLALVRELLADFEVAVEFRQARWMDAAHRDRTVSFLEAHHLAYVCVDEPQGFPSSVPPVVAVTADVAVVRFHGRNAQTWEAKDISPAERFRYLYSDEELAEWLPRLDAILAERPREIHVVFNNCYSDYGVRSGARFAHLLRRHLGDG